MIEVKWERPAYLLGNGDQRVRQGVDQVPQKHGPSGLPHTRSNLLNISNLHQLESKLPRHEPTGDISYPSHISHRKPYLLPLRTGRQSKQVRDGKMFCET